MSLIERDTTRKINFEPGINPYAAGSVIASFGNTKIHITASVEERVPPFLKGKESGWVTAEYSMLPGSTHDRVRRERSKVSGRTQEIQRLIGRSLRAIIDLKKLGERTIVVDCDVLVADGGTRTTSVTGAYVALHLAIEKLLKDELIESNPLNAQIAAISVGINKEGKIIADLNYIEDSTCETDMNIVMTKEGDFVEIQGTAEGRPFTSSQLEALIECSNVALKGVFQEQDRILLA